MTILVGVRCVDGVVIGADSIATSANGHVPTMQIPSNNKITVFQKNMMAATTGDVGLAQRLSRNLEHLCTHESFDSLDLHDFSGLISHMMIKDCQHTGIYSGGPTALGLGALVAAPIQGVPHLIEFDPIRFQPEVKQDRTFYVSMGAGQMHADPFLAFISRVIWKNRMPSVDVGKFGVYWALDHAIRVAPGGVGHPINIAVLKADQLSWNVTLAEDFQEGAQYVDELEAYISRFTSEPFGDTNVSTLPVMPTKSP